MRKLMWFTVGFGICCGLGAYMDPGPWLLFLSIASLPTAIALFFTKPMWAKIIATAILGVAVAGTWLYGYQLLYLAPAESYDDQVVQASAEITDYSYPSAYGTAAEATITLDGKDYRTILYLDLTDQLSPGDRLTGEFYIRATTAASSRGETYHPGKGIFMLAYQQGSPELAKASRTPLFSLPALLRRQISDTLHSLFPEDTVGFAKALLLGDSSSLTYEDNTAFKVSGIRHVIAVSGLHVSILFSLVHLFFGRQRFANALVGLPLLLLFAAVAGFTPSVSRACIMQALMLLAALVDKEYDPPTALAFSALVMLFINPMVITSVSFQLSVGCVIGIFTLFPKTNRYLQKLLRCPSGKGLRARLTRWVCSSIAITLSAMTVTVPLSAVYFGIVSIIGILTNLATMWIISFLFYGIMLACGIGMLWAGAGKLLAWVISWGIRYVLLAANIISEVPFGAVYTCSGYIVCWLVCSYLLLALFLMLKNKRPMLLIACVTASLLVSVVASVADARLQPMRVTVMDVGQGQAILLESKGNRYLVDCGSEYIGKAADTVSQQLLSQGIFSLDGIILTHYDKDHAADVLPLMSRIYVQSLYLPQIPDDGPYREQIASAFPERIVWVEQNTTLQGDWGSLTMIAGPLTNDENESGLCILFQAQDCDILITGDRGVTGERTLIKDYPLPKLELLVAGHHGAAGSTSYELLSATRPRCAVISVGENNLYGHPAPDVITRLEKFNCRVLRTDTHGTIEFAKESIWQNLKRLLTNCVS